MSTGPSSDNAQGPGGDPADVAARICEYLADGKPRRYSEIVTALGKPSLGGVLARLEKTGHVVKLSRGVYALAGSAQALAKAETEAEAGTEPQESAAAAVAERRLGPGQQRVYDLLAQPKSASELKQLLGVTSQAVDQHLKALMGRDLVRRVKIVGEGGGYVYLRASDEPPVALAGRSPILRGSAAKVLSAVPPDAPTTLAALVGSGPAAGERRRLAETLESVGLITIEGPKHLELVRLTDSGREHPAYDPSAPKARALPEAPDEHDPKLRILLALHALGRASGHDLMLAIGIGAGEEDLDADNLVEGLERDGLVEPVAHDADGEPIYRLSLSGLALLATLRGKVAFPDASELWKHLALEKAKAREARLAPARETDERTSAIIEILRERGPMAATVLNPLLPSPYADHRNLRRTLNRLVQRGVLVRRQADDRGVLLWGVPDAPHGS